MTGNSNADATAVVDLAAERAARFAQATDSQAIDGQVIAGQVIEARHDLRDTDDAPEALDLDDDAPRLVDGVVIAHHGRAVPSGRGFAAGVRDAVTRKALPDRPVVPAWMRDRETARSAAAWAGRYAAHSVGFHTVRLPVYWARLAARAPVGVYRIGAVTFRWVFDADGRMVRRAMASAAGGSGYGTQDATAWSRLDDQRRRNTRFRAWVAGGSLAVLVIAVWVVAATQPAWVAVLTGAVLLAALGAFGRDADTRVVSRYTDAADVPKFDGDLIMTALENLGLAGLNKAFRVGDGVRFPSPVQREGAGWRAEIDLPPGVTATQVIDKRDGLASGLRRPTSSVWPEADNDVHAGRLVLWVADKPMSKAKPVTWPLAAKGSVDLFQPFPLGVDPRGRTVTVTLMFASMVIGAQPRAGKTFTGRVCMLGAALDPRAELHIFDLKGGADWKPLSPVCHSFRTGDEAEDVAYILTALRALAKDMRTRYATLRGLPRDVCPEGKVTPELASRKSLGLHPVLVFIDECQKAFEDPSHGKEIEALVTDLTKRGPAAGLTMISATQRPDKDSLPTGIRSNAVLRLCLRVASQVENDMVLGTSMYQAGYRATMFNRSEAGVGYLAGEGDDPVIVRSAYIDAVQADKIIARARAARIAAGRLTGYAADQDLTPDETSASVLDHLAAVWPPAEDRAWCDTLAARLAEAFPTTYAGWTAGQITDAVKPHGLATRQIKIDGQNRRGLRRDDLAAALANRDDDSPATTRDASAEAPGRARMDGAGESLER